MLKWRIQFYLQHSIHFVWTELEDNVQGEKCCVSQKCEIVQFSSVQDGIYTVGKAHMCSTPSLRSFPSVAFETVPTFDRLTMTLFRPFKEYRPALHCETASQKDWVLYCTDSTKAAKTVRCSTYHRSIHATPGQSDRTADPW